MSTTVQYKGNTLTTISNATKTLKTAGKYMEGDVILTDTTSGGSTINNQNKTITPTESQQSITADSGYTGLGTVTVNAISSTYIGSAIEARDSDDLTVSGVTITAPAGYYSAAASKSVSSMTLPTAAASSATSGYTSKATIECSTAAQYINIPPGYNSTGAYYVISAVPNGSVTTPSSISGTAASVSTGTNTLTLTKTVSVTPNVTTVGYISSGTAGNSSVSLTANVTVDPTPTTSGATVTIPAGYYTTQTTKSVSSGSATGPSSLSESSASVSTGTNTLTLTKTGVTTTPTVSAGYVSSATASTATVALTASVTVNPTPTASGATVTIPAGYYSSQTTKSVTSGSATAPSTISGTAASVSTGTNTLTLSKTISVTPTVNAGYVSSGTAGNASVSLTASVTTKGATTYHPSTTAQSISSGTYLTGTQTINAVTTSNLTADNIKSGVTVKIGDSSDDDCVASILGTYTGGSGASNIVQGSFTATSTSGGTTTVTVPYTGSGYPIAFIISLDGGSTYDTTTKRYAITAGYGVKKLTANAMTYDKTASNDGFSVQCIYKGSSGTTYSSGGSVSVTIGNQDAPSASASLWVSIHSKTDFRFFTMVSSYGLYPGKKYNYTIIYSS